MPDAGADPVADLRRANAELVASRRAALNALEDAVAARDALDDREAWLRGQRAALEAALSGAPLTASLGRLVRTATAALGGGTRAAFYLANDDATALRHVVGMPSVYAELVEGLANSPESLACGPAAHGREPVVTADVTTDPRWEDWRWLAHQFDYRGYWNFPITTIAGTFVGTLAFYWPQPKQAAARELELADLLTHTAGVIISRHREAEARRQAEAALAAEKEYAQSIIQTLHEPLLVLRLDLSVKSVNEAFYTHFRVNPADTIGRKVYELGNGQWHIPALRTLLEVVLPDSNVFNDYEVTHTFESIGRRVMLVNGRRLDHVQLILLGIRDITERKQAEERQAFLLKLSDALRPLADPAAVQNAAARALGERLGVSRAMYAEVEGGPGGERGTIRGRYLGPGAEALGAFPERYEYGHYGERAMALRRGGEPMVVADVTTDPAFSAPERTAWAAGGVRAAVTVPLVKGGRFVADFGVQSATAREWTAGEVALVKETAERTWAAVERARAEEALRASEEKFAALFAASPAPFLIVKPDAPRFTIFEVNAAYLTAAMRTRDGLIGRGLFEAFPDNPADPTADGVSNLRASFERALASRRADAMPVQKYDIARPDGTFEERWWNPVNAPVVGRSGGVEAIIHHVSDVTEQYRAAAALRASEERLRMALAAARMGIWTLDADTGTQTRDANLNALLGLEAVETAQPFTEFCTHIHPDDRAAVRAAFDQSVRHGRPLSTEFRVVWPDGTVRWLRDQGDVFGTAGQVRMTGACVDVTDLKEAEAAARRSEERLRLTVEGATDYAILTLSPDRAVTSWSPGAEATFGWLAAEMLGRSGDELFTPEDRAAGAPEREAGQAVREGRAADERWHVRKDGGRFWASGVTNPLGPGGALGFVKVLRDLTERKRLADAVRQARDDLERLVAERTAELAAALEALEGEMARRRDLARRLGTAQEDERRRVARDLHDTVGQLLTGLSLAFKAVEATAGLPPPAAAKLAGAQRIMSDLGRELHGLAVRLRPTALDDVGLESALPQLVSEWSSRAGVRADCHASGLGPGRLPAEVETTVYRVVQEALTNVAKHARAAQVSVVVTRPPDGRVSVVVEDDGEGFDPAALPKGRLGLLGMRERVEQVGGTIEVESSPGAGTTVLVQIPLPNGSAS